MNFRLAPTGTHRETLLEFKRLLQRRTHSVELSPQDWDFLEFCDEHDADILEAIESKLCL